MMYDDFWVNQISNIRPIMTGCTKYSFHKFCNFFVGNLTNLTALDQTLWLLYSDLCARLLSAGSFQCTHETLAVKGQEQVLPLSLMMTAHLKVPAGMTRSRQTQTGVTVFVCLNGFQLFLITLLMSSLLHAGKKKSAMKGSSALVLLRFQQFFSFFQAAFRSRLNFKNPRMHSEWKSVMKVHTSFLFLILSVNNPPKKNLLQYCAI